MIFAGLILGVLLSGAAVLAVRVYRPHWLLPRKTSSAIGAGNSLQINHQQMLSQDEEIFDDEL